MNQEVLTNIVLVLISTFGPVIALYLGNLVRESHMRAKREHWYALVAEFAHTAVAAAEQLGLTDQLEGLASSKFDYALGQVETMLMANGIKLNIDVPLSYIKAIIEAEVNRMPQTLTGEVLHINN